MRHLPLFCIFILPAAAYNVLIYNPKFSYSHVNFMNKIGTFLVEAGHNVTVLQPIVDHTLRDLKLAGTTVVMPQDPRVYEKSAQGQESFSDLWEDEVDVANLFDMILELFTNQCEANMLQKDILKQLSETKFDVGISEVFDNCGHGLFEMLKIPAIISASSSSILDYQADIFGVPLGISYVPGLSLVDASKKLTMKERILNAIESKMSIFANFFIIDAQTSLFQKHISPEFRNLRDVIADSSYMLTNSIPLLDYPRPTIHKVLDVGGIAIATAKILNEEWSEILSRREQNVYISFGSVAKSFTMPQHFKESIMQVAREMNDVTFIWKYEKDDLINVPENLIITKWTPQNDLLADERLSLFITHGGMGSTTEIAMSGCVALLIPLFADQPRNAGMLRRHRGAEVFSKNDLPRPDKLKAAIQNLLENKEYKSNAVKLSNLIVDSPHSTKELLLKYIEFAAKYGALPQLDHYGRQQSFIEYFLIDVLAVFSAIMISIILIISFVVRVVFSKVLYGLFSVMKLKTN